MKALTCRSCEHYRPGVKPFQCAMQQTGAPHRRAEHCRHWSYEPGSDFEAWMREAEGEA